MCRSQGSCVCVVCDWISGEAVSAGELELQVVQARCNAAVDDIVTDLHPQTAHDGCVYDHVDFDISTVERAESGTEPGEAGAPKPD